MLDATITNNLSAELIEKARRLPTTIEYDLQRGISTAVEQTEQSVRDMLSIDRGNLESIGLAHTKSVDASQVIIDDRHTIALQAFSARQVPGGVEVETMRGFPPQFYPKAFLYNGSVYVRQSGRSIRKVADIYLWDLAGPRAMAEQLPETTSQFVTRFLKNSIDLLVKG